MIKCSNPECGDKFQPNSHNQKYCGEECRRTVTNKRIMDKYYEEKEIRNGETERWCETGCGTILTRYNLTSICFACTNKKEKGVRAIAARLII